MNELIRCPFCLWYRMANLAKGSQPFDRDVALLAMVEHMLIEHTVQAGIMLGVIDQLTAEAEHGTIIVSRSTSIPPAQ